MHCEQNNDKLFIELRGIYMYAIWLIQPKLSDFDSIIIVATADAIWRTQAKCFCGLSNFE